MSSICFYTCLQRNQHTAWRHGQSMLAVGVRPEARFPFKRNRLRCIRCVRCVNENRKKRKRLFSRNKRKRQPIGMLGRSSGNHDWLLANASACVSCAFRLRNASNASYCIWMETGLEPISLSVVHKRVLYIHIFMSIQLFEEINRVGACTVCAKQAYDEDRIKTTSDQHQCVHTSAAGAVARATRCY